MSRNLPGLRRKGRCGAGGTNRGRYPVLRESLSFRIIGVWRHLQKCKPMSLRFERLHIDAVGVFGAAVFEIPAAHVQETKLIDRHRLYAELGRFDFGGRVRSVARKSAPLPFGPAETRISPPWLRTISRTMASPRPAPPSRGSSVDAL